MNKQVLLSLQDILHYIAFDSYFQISTASHIFAASFPTVSSHCQHNIILCFFPMNKRVLLSFKERPYNVDFNSYFQISTASHIFAASFPTVSSHCQHNIILCFFPMNKRVLLSFKERPYNVEFDRFSSHSRTYSITLHSIDDRL
mmetsp:Transcript_35617/g.52195  ORF Transcript_35617/g.52195 Transcript_35617/m.52195 type:complete len:144 (-) Transcript_35617:492-923(-)